MARAASKAAMARALAALDAAGLVAASITIQPGGAVVIVPGPKAGLTAKGPAAEVDSLDGWREQKRGRHAAQGS